MNPPNKNHPRNRERSAAIKLTIAFGFIAAFTSLDFVSSFTSPATNHVESCNGWFPGRRIVAAFAQNRQAVRAARYQRVQAYNQAYNQAYGAQMYGYGSNGSTASAYYVVEQPSETYTTYGSNGSQAYGSVSYGSNGSATYSSQPVYIESPVAQEQREAAAAEIGGNEPNAKPPASDGAGGEQQQAATSPPPAQPATIIRYRYVQPAAPRVYTQPVYGQRYYAPAYSRCIGGVCY